MSPECIHSVVGCLMTMLSNVKDLLVSGRFFNTYSTALFYVCCGLVCVWIYKKTFKSKLKLPHGPVGLPVFGYLPFLGPEPFRTLNDLTKKYGNVFSLYFGRTFVVILGDYEATKDALGKSTTIDRPEKLFDFIPGGVGFSSVNGKEWVEQRRFSVRAMRNLGLGTGKWEAIIAEEVQNFVKQIHELHGQSTDIDKLLISSISNNIASLVLGKRLALDDPKRDFLNYSIIVAAQAFSQSGFRIYFSTLCDVFMKLGIGNYKKLHNDLVAFNEFIKNEIREHELASSSSPDFINTYLMEMKTKMEENVETSFNETNLCGNVTALLIGGSDTTRTSLNWLLLAMVKYPSIQEKVHKELNSVLGAKNRATWDDRHKLPYTYAVILEGQRWKTVAPLNTSRIAQENITICGYDIPKGTTIIANNWGMHNDTKYWKDPELFIPDRFLKDEGTVVFKPESYLPFSYGKRNCPGETVAMMEILLYFCSVMQDFKVTAPPGEYVKLDGILGITYQAVPQKLCLVPRTLL